jgi:histidine triad (HIT) family protein
VTKCIFCDIADKKLAAHILFEDDIAVAFLDKTPLFAGHVLVIPRPHVVTLPELAADLVGPFFERVQAVARAIPKALGSQGTFVAMNNVVSQSVAHLHVHVVPRTKGDGLKGFFWPRTKYASEEQMRETAAKIRPHLEVVL